MAKHIDCACREYEWSSRTGKPAPWPEFAEKKINEKLIPHPERFKEYGAYIEGDEGFVDWTTQESTDPSEEFNAEIIRAFKANGLKQGCLIHVNYGMRGEAVSASYSLTV